MKDNILVFRRKNKSLAKEYRDIQNNYLNKYHKYSDIQYISDEITDTDFIFSINFGKKLFYSNHHIRRNVIKIANINDVYLRERYFRDNMNYAKAKDIIYFTYSYFYNLFSKNKFSLIITIPIDNFITDVFCRVGSHFKIEVLGLQRFFIKNTYRVCSRGEYNKIRDVSEEEIDAFISNYSIEKNVFKGSKIKNLYNVMFYYFVYKIKYCVHYLFFYKVLGLRFYKYFSTKSQVYPKNIINRIIFYNNHVNQDSFSNAKKKIYIPLHYYPEATVEYWMNDSKYIDYYSYLFYVVESLTAKGYKVLIKEHPAAYLKRDTNLLKPIVLNNDVQLFSPFHSSTNLIQKSDAVVVWTGTTGIESLMLNKPIFFIEKNFYSKGIFRDWKDLLNDNVCYKPQDKKNAVRNLLETTIILK